MKFIKENLIGKFLKYVNEYDTNDENITRKYYHSIRVMNFSENIAISERLSENDIEIAVVAGLLHDYARFIQWTNYHTYSDIESIDHGNLSSELLFNKNEIFNFYKNVKNYDELYDAIKYHNKYKVPSKISAHNRIICYIVRDADKLDIFDMLVNNNLDLKETEVEISGKVKKSFFNNQTIDYKIIKSSSDDIIFKLAMLFDLKYKYSINYIIDNNIINKLYEKIKNKKKVEIYFKYMTEYMNSMK